MAENVTIEPGTRVKIGGLAYKTVESAEALAELTPVKVQVNRHAKVLCLDTDCLRDRPSKYGTFGRISYADKATQLGYFPRCYHCRIPMSLEPDTD